MHVKETNPELFVNLLMLSSPYMEKYQYVNHELFQALNAIEYYNTFSNQHSQFANGELHFLKPFLTPKNMPDVVLYNRETSEFILFQYKFIYRTPYKFIMLQDFAGKYVWSDIHQIGCVDTPLGLQQLDFVNKFNQTDNEQLTNIVNNIEVVNYSYINQVCDNPDFYIDKIKAELVNYNNKPRTDLCRVRDIMHRQDFMSNNMHNRSIERLELIRLWRR